MLPEIIHSDQSAFVKNRWIGNSIRSVNDVMDYAKEKNKAGMLLFLDFEKAFDSIEWPFLFHCLKVFNFGSSFCHWISVFYTNISSCVINQGTTSHYFQVTRGVRQGDPLSPFLFILAVEVLAVSIRANNNIKGITIGQRESKLIQFADDTTVVLDCIGSAKYLFKLLTEFAEISGLKINKDKTQGLWIGKDRCSEKNPFGISWPKKAIKVLGIYFSYNQDEEDSENFNPILKKLKATLNIWRQRNMTLYSQNSSALIAKFYSFIQTCPRVGHSVDRISSI